MTKRFYVEEYIKTEVDLTMDLALALLAETKGENSDTDPPPPGRRINPLPFEYGNERVVRVARLNVINVVERNTEEDRLPSDLSASVSTNIKREDGPHTVLAVFRNFLFDTSVWCRFWDALTKLRLASRYQKY
jgi:hypothetical protein